MRIRTIAMVLAAVLGGAGWAIAGCATYISTSQFDSPGTGYLLGESLVTEEVTYGVRGGPGHVNRTVRITYSVGYYRMTSGHVQEVDCRTYSAI